MTLAFPIEARQGTALWISLGGHNTLIITDNFPFLTSLFCYNKNKVEINCYICKIELLVITSLFINQYIKLACKHSCWGSKYIPIWIAEVCLIIIFISIYERRGGRGHSVAILSFYNEYFFNRQSVHLSVCSSRGEV